MSVIKVKSKKAKNGYTYKVTFKYKEFGITKSYSKSGFSTKKKALEHENAIKASIKENGYLKKECKLTLNEVYEEFLKVGCSKYQTNTIYNTKKDYVKIPLTLKKYPIARINYAMLQEYFNSLENQGIETNKNIKKTLNRIFKYAIKKEYIILNPLTHVDIKGVDNKMIHEEILSLDDFNRIINALNGFNKFSYTAYAIAIEIGYYTGLRVSEVLALDRNDIDFNNDLINVDKKLIYKGLKKDELYATHQMKSKKSKAIIPLATPLKKVLLEWLDNNPYDKVICDIEGFYINPDVLSNVVKRIAGELNIDFHYHMLRHTFITNLVNNGVDIKTVQELARHSNINTTLSVYTHIQNEHKKQVIDNVFDINYSKNTLKIN